MPLAMRFATTMFWLLAALAALLLAQPAQALSYNSCDNLTRITDRLDAAKTQSFAYDAVGRLSRVTLASGDMQRTDYVYDANGNKTRELRRPLPTDPPSVAVVDRYTLAPGSNRLAKIVMPNGNRTLGYDPRGNMLKHSQ